MKQNQLIALLIALIAARVSCRDFSLFQLLRATPHDDNQLNYLRQLDSNLDFEQSPIEFWKLSKHVHEPSDLMVSRLVGDQLQRKLSQLGITSRVLIENVGR